MANWFGATRTNYVHVKDIKAVEEIFKPFDLELIFDKEKRVGFLSTNEYGNWPSSVYAEDDEYEENEIEFDFKLIVPQLVEGEVLVVVCCGAEKMRYLTGESVAYAWDGRVTSVSMDDIYDKVITEFGVITTTAEY